MKRIFIIMLAVTLLSFGQWWEVFKNQDPPAYSRTQDHGPVAEQSKDKSVGDAGIYGGKTGTKSQSKSDGGADNDPTGNNKF